MLPDFCRGWARMPDSGMAIITCLLSKVHSVAARWWFYPLILLASLCLVALGVVALTIVLLYPSLPSVEVLTDYRPKIPLRIYTADGDLIGEFGEEKRAVVAIKDVPELLKKAILAAEDERFYSHSGVDYWGVGRAALSNLTTGARTEGASTITMQVAQNFFLTKEKTFTRKISQALLAFKIEQNLTKDQILEIYINHIFLGQRAYGFSSAAQVYYGKEMKDLQPAEVAMLAGLPKAPSRFNPVVNPKRATQRQHYVLRRMRDLGYLKEDQYQQAMATPLKLNAAQNQFPVPAEHVAEMARKEVFDLYGDTVYVSGMKVYTTIRSADQIAAVESLRRGVMDYDRRHGYRGPEGRLNLPADPAQRDEAIEEALAEREVIADLYPAVVIESSPKQIVVVNKRGESITITGDGLRQVARLLGDKASQLKPTPGAVVRIYKEEKGGWAIAQLPRVEAAFVSVSPVDGAVRALVGGVDFGSNKFNRITQAWRQPGSSFKPFIYSAALEKGFSPATVVNDAPVVVDPGRTGGQIWEPKNYDGKYEGPMRLRTALAKSKNMVSIRVLQAIGPEYAQEYVGRFGFQAEKHPPYLTMALGAGSVTPMQMAAAYSSFANGGFRISPYVIATINDDKGATIYAAKPQKAGQDAERVLDARNAFLMTSLMREVVRSGTATRAQTLGRQDLAGKTGTTNDHNDAWFAGFNDSLVGVAWIGFDTPADLGANETGGQAALPIWIGYMTKALKGVPENELEVPDGVVAVNVDPVSGLRDGGAKDAIKEFFYAEMAPGTSEAPAATKERPRPTEEVKNQIF
ncbi:MAG: penicillin-binding protein 1A [Burkholderiales bacterium]|nr:penicillin-binding protein 1A [Burkholderiales bacterium]